MTSKARGKNTQEMRQSPDEIEIQYVKGVGPRRAEIFAKLGVNNLADLLYHLPRRYEDRTHFENISKLQPGIPVTLKGRIVAVDMAPTKSRMDIVKAHLDDGTGIIELVWFNQRWMKARLLNKEKEFIVYGVPQESGWGLQIVSPEWEELEKDGDALSANRIVPIYPLTEGLSQKVVRQIMWVALEAYLGLFSDCLPEELRRKYRLGPLQKCLRQVHYPDRIENIEIARQRLIFEEFLLLQLSLAMKRADVEIQPGIAFDINDDLVNRVQEHLPFTLTNAQVRVIQEIIADMRKPNPMSRLLQGDVGSGKTIVAASAIAAAVYSGYQAALMVPTELLAEQHYRAISSVLERLSIQPELLIGRMTAKQKVAVKKRIADGESWVVVGTQALIQENVEFKKLGLVVIDEQHRFGVMQRASLMQKGINPDVLVMTATPIPRTLAMTLYGDLDVSIIDELPVGRKPIKTKWKKPEDRPSVYSGIRTIVEEGRQVYLVCPLITESEKLQAKAAQEMAEHLQKDIFPDLRIGLLHGSLKADERNDVMDRFRAGDVDILVATTVIEVGVDVANATAMVIEDAHRFGLAQLHQLRGRVGRSDQQSYCVLVADPRNDGAVHRMTTMVKTTNGFEIAEEDLLLRGPGEVYGTKQSGIPAFKVADLIKDHRLLEEARKEAFEIVNQDRTLSTPEHQPLKAQLEHQHDRVSVATIS